MKCGPPEQAVIPSIAHSGRKVKGRERAPAGSAAFVFPGLSGLSGPTSFLVPGTCHAQHACLV